MSQQKKTDGAPRCGRAMLISVLGLGIAWTSHSAAQEQECKAGLRISSRGVPTVTENWRSLMRRVGSYSYRLDATTDEKRCANVTFNIVLRYVNRDGKADTGTYPGSMRIRGGEGTELGQLPGHREDADPRVTIEEIVCKPC